MTKPSFHINADGSYLIAGGLGGLGRIISRWLVERGVKYLILLSQSGAKSEASRMSLLELKQFDVNVTTPPCDIIDIASLQKVLEQCAIDIPLIKGCL